MFKLITGDIETILASLIITILNILPISLNLSNRISSYSVVVELELPYMPFLAGLGTVARLAPCASHLGFRNKPTQASDAAYPSRTCLKTLNLTPSSPKIQRATECTPCNRG
jgi:hypothetical protein